MQKAILMAALCGLVFVSCNKQNNISESTSSTPQRAGNKGPAYIASMGKYSYVSDSEPCSKANGNCIKLKEVVVRPNQKILIMNAGASGPTAVGALFSGSDFAALCNELPATAADKLKSGTYAIKMGYDGDKVFDFLAGYQVVNSAAFEFVVELTVGE